MSPGDGLKSRITQLQLQRAGVQFLLAQAAADHSRKTRQS